MASAAKWYFQGTDEHARVTWTPFSEEVSTRIQEMRIQRMWDNHVSRKQPKWRQKPEHLSNKAYESIDMCSWIPSNIPLELCKVNFRWSPLFLCRGNMFEYKSRSSGSGKSSDDNQHDWVGLVAVPTMGVAYPWTGRILKHTFEDAYKYLRADPDIWRLLRPPTSIDSRRGRSYLASRLHSFVTTASLPVTWSKQTSPRHVMLQGTYRKASPLWLLGGFRKLILKNIFAYEGAEADVEFGTAAFGIISRGHLFPEPSGLHVNMMPIKLSSKLPKFVRQYKPLVQACRDSLKERDGIAYLTIDEGSVIAGKTQRRPGLHTETPGNLTRGGLLAGGPSVTEARAHDKLSQVSTAWDGWGAGELLGYDAVMGGIFMCSNVSNSTLVYDAKVGCVCLIDCISLARHRFEYNMSG